MLKAIRNLIDHRYNYTSKFTLNGAQIDLDDEIRLVRKFSTKNIIIDKTAFESCKPKKEQVIPASSVTQFFSAQNTCFSPKVGDETFKNRATKL